MTALKEKAIVLDSWSVIAYLEDEPAGKRVEEIIVQAQERDIPLLATVINAGEIWYITARKTSERDADETLRELQRLGIKFIDADWTLTRAASVLKSRHRMSSADCFAAALAKTRGASLATGDPEFKQVKDEIKILWL